MDIFWNYTLSLKLNISLILFTRHDIIEIADPSRMLDAFLFGTFVMGLEHGSMQSEGLRFNSSWRLRIFLCPTLVTRQKNIFV